MTIPILQIDAFADRPFGGNPAAVCLLTTPAPANWMQRVAEEMNLAETAFLSPAGGEYLLRWFTPNVEVELCGHATVAASHALWETGALQPGSEARFTTLSGILTARKSGEWIELDFPATPADMGAVPDQLIAALGVRPRATGKTRFDYFVELASEEEVRDCQPDMAQLMRVPVRGVIVTAKASMAGADFVSRFFGPQSGVAEDPVTGSSHCCLAPYWAERLGRTELTGYQASARGGFVRVRLAGDRVLLGGKAVTVLRGELSEAACDW